MVDGTSVHSQKEGGDVHQRPQSRDSIYQALPVFHVFVPCAEFHQLVGEPGNEAMLNQECVRLFLL